MSVQCQVAIIGGGLTGLALLDHLHAHGINAHLFEARSRLGGRILSRQIGHETRDSWVDLGPSWFWPGQPLIAELARRFAIPVFEQYSQGSLVFEDEKGALQHYPGFSPMAGALRLDGGMVALIAGFENVTPSRVRHIGQGLHKLRLDTSVEGFAADGQQLFQAHHCVLAMPPRLAARLVFEPALPSAMVDRLMAVPTWMAAHTKIVVGYTQPFWRQRGLSGSAISRSGPLFEVHDASGPSNDTLGALFGFTNAQIVTGKGKQNLQHAVKGQLIGLFGPQAGDCISIDVKDWSSDTWTATTMDKPSSHHPTYGPLPSEHDMWADKLTIASTESSTHSGGLMEGALETAATTAQALASLGKAPFSAEHTC